RSMVSLDDLEDLPRLTFDQGANNSFYFAEEILSTRSSQREIQVSDRATIFNLMIGLGGYTISTGIISDELDPSIVSIPLDVEERIDIGWIDHAAIPLTEQARRYLDEVRAVVAGFGVEVLG
ncbi:LysR family transcriptional regulator, partial [Glutamicibacter ardleyensis]